MKKKIFIDKETAEFSSQRLRSSSSFLKKSLGCLELFKCVKASLFMPFGCGRATLSQAYWAAPTEARYARCPLSPSVPPPLEAFRITRAVVVTAHLAVLIH